MPKLFTVDEANALLPELREILDRLRALAKELERVEAEAGDVRWKVRTNGYHVSTEPLERQEATRAAAVELVKRIQDLGCELKDPRDGLVDFPAMHRGQRVYLCWKLDEPSVQYWHSLHGGFATREKL
jgi:hypothetical protein